MFFYYLSLTLSFQEILRRWNSILRHEKLFSKYCYVFPDRQLNCILKIYSEYHLTLFYQITAVKISYR